MSDPKKMWIDAYTNDEYVEDPPNLVCVELTDTMIELIQRMGAVLTTEEALDLDLYTVSKFNYAPRWYESNIYDLDINRIEYLWGLPEGVTLKDARFDCVTLHVSKTMNDVEFWWKGYIKHTGIEFRTRRLPLYLLTEVPA